MNGYSVIINKSGSISEDILLEVLALEKAVISLKDKLLKIIPAKYGSDAWWEQETAKSLEDYKNGEYVEIKNKKDLHLFLSDLKK